MILYSSCDSYALPSDFKMLIRAAGRDYSIYYEVVRDHYLKAYISDCNLIDGEVGEVEHNEIKSEKTVYVSRSRRQELLQLVQPVREKEKEEVTSYVADGIEVYLWIDGKQFYSNLFWRDPDKNKYEGRFADDDVMHVMGKLLNIISFPRDEDWGTTYQWIERFDGNIES